MIRALNALLQEEKSVEEMVPYTIHVTPHNIRTSAGDMLTIIKVDGLSHQTANVEDLQLWHDQLNNLFKNIADPQVALWRTTIRRKQAMYPGGEFPPGFAHDLNQHYREVMSKETMMVNDHYLTLVLRGEPKLASLFRSAKRTQAEVDKELNERSAALDELAQTVTAALSDYNPKRLGFYDRRVANLGLSPDRPHSAPAEFLSFLLNGEWTPVPAPRRRLSAILPIARPTFGVDTGQLRGVTDTQLFAILGVNEYPETTVAGDLNELMALPFEIVTTQSMSFFERQKSLEMMKSQQRKLRNAGDAARSQVEELDEAMDDLASGRITYGDHHLSVMVKAPNDEELAKRVAKLRSALTNSGFIVAREDVTNEAAYWAQLPGNFKWRPRTGLISSRNAAGLMAMHNFPQGKADRNQWGPALALLKTTSGTPYFFNFHLPIKGKREDGKESDDERVAGNTLLVGPTGAGKTVVQTFLVAMAEKYSPTVFTFDKDYGQENFIRGMGGVYSVIRKGEDTGFNPLMLPPTPRNVLFVNDLVQSLVRRPGETLTADVEYQITQAVTAVMNMPRVAMKRFETLRSFFPETVDGVNVRLKKWCAGESLGWALDCATDTLSTEGNRYFGFDMTEVLDDGQVRSPIIMYLFHRMEDMIQGQPFIMNMDEFWKMLDDIDAEKKANDVVKTIRKRNGLALLGTQSPKDVLKSRIAHSLIEQCVTKIFLPAPMAEEADYIGGFKLTQREFECVKYDMPIAKLRGFLVKQGMTSAVCELNLAGFDDELAVLSGTTASVDACRRAIAKAGNDPQKWLPVFHQLRKE
ncbi:VirB4 family type IV secretion/conjugal transfer ATPase [Stenotrophomonas maltophilia]|uniref:VirB4 family type IV secretion/conjugal transfer ATPase n=1 Tax=Stenotrophomonas maltophilia TaxID=40324 RepID=UPI00066B6255|nr:VirB4 family type IV secretion/conjugal transfer ATPase [Stenotrophomonas maltophilia]